jgi:hypothetical protein
MLGNVIYRVVQFSVSRHCYVFFTGVTYQLPQYSLLDDLGKYFQYIGFLVYFCTVLIMKCHVIPWTRVVLEKVTGSQLVKKFPAFYGTRMSPPPVLTLNQINSVHAPHQTSWRYVSMLSSHLRLSLPSALFPSGLPTKHSMHLCSPHTYFMFHPSRSSRFDHPNNTCWESISFSLCSLLHAPVTLSLLVPNIVSFLESTHFWSLSIFRCFRSIE